ncbi:MAG: phosphodiesterase [Candidatus Heteroscillospira sp.]|jgi:putative phosphoesterase
MKLMIASDIHGSSYWCRKLMDEFEREQPHKLLLLGDILYHGPRNDLPQGYDPKAVIAMLNPLADRILCVRGNCEAEVDQMVLSFPCLADYALLCLDGQTLIAAHGHREHPRPAAGDILVTGHTHVTLDCMENGCRHLNPGSVSLPKENTPRGYIIMAEGEIEFRTLD